jgi:penicillin-binding protein 1A
VTDLLPDPGDDWRVKLKRLLLDLDARIDSAVYQSGNWTREAYERFTAFMDNWHVAGWRRWLFIEPLSEAATLGTGGIILMLALAIPSFRETSDEDWLKKSELAVSFLDRYGNEVAASSTMIRCRSRRCPTISSRRCWRPRTAASTSISASIFTAPSAP